MSYIGLPYIDSYTMINAYPLEAYVVNVLFMFYFASVPKDNAKSAVLSPL